MRALSKVSYNTLKSNSIFNKLFPSGLIKNMTSNRPVFNGLSRQNSLFKSMNEKYFSEKKKDKEESKEKEEKQDKNDKSEEEEDEKIINEKYNELKKQYNAQLAKMEVFTKKFEDLRAVYLSNVEETEQIKIRTDREIANTKEYAISKFAKDLLDVYDNFQRAMESVADKDFKSLPENEKLETYNGFLEGIELTKSCLSHVLKRHGVSEFDPLKEKFDPNKHEAVFDYEDDELNPGTVGQVLQTGFKIGERVLRPAKVGVIKRHHK